MRPILALLSLLLAGCATSDPDYLKKISLDISSTHLEKKSDEIKPGKTTATPGPFPDDFPPSRVIVFRDKRPYEIFASGKSIYAFPAWNVVRFYDLSGISNSRTISLYLRDLKKALHERRDARALESPCTSLPDYPRRNAGHLVQEKVQYVDFPWGRGVFYLCAFTQGPGNFPNNDELIYLFQGLSNDHRIYVSADFRVTSRLISRTEAPSIEEGGSDIDRAANALAKKLNQEPDNAFSPDLSTIRDRMKNIRLPEK